MINTSALRSKILVSAMHGQLSERLSSDSVVDALYEDIIELKNGLIKSKAIRKDAKLEEIIEPEYELPSEWKWVRFGKIITLQSGQDLKSNEYNASNDGIPYMTGASNFNDDGTLTINRWTETPKSIAKCGDILISVKGTVGKVAVVFEEEVHIARQIMGIRTYKLNVDFVKYFVESEIERIKAASKGLIPGIERNDILNMSFPLPPIEEQKRISDRITEAFHILETIDELQAAYSSNLEVLKAKIIDAGIQGKLTERLPGDGNAEDLYAAIQEEKAKIYIERKSRKNKKTKPIDDDTPFVIPEHWRWVRLGDVGLFKKGPFGSALTKSMFVPKTEQTVKVYEQQHAIKKDSSLGTYYITREYFDERMSGFEVLPGDIIVSCAGTIGETYIMPDGIEQGIINQALMRITLPLGISKRFFQYYFDANLKKSAQEESNGSAIKNIPPFDVLKNWYFPLIPYEEQLRIVESIDATLNVIK